MGSVEEHDIEEELKVPFKFLINIYQEAIRIGGETMANNLLRLSARKRLDEGEVEFLVNSVREVAME
jgi:hypothetical protein